MDIDKEKLQYYYVSGQMDDFFREADRISSYLIYSFFKIYNKDVAEDLRQECLENLWKKITQNKVDPTKNLFAFIWKNSYWRVMEILRKEGKRKNKVQFCEYDEIEGFGDSLVFDNGFGNRHVSVLVKELSTVC